MLIQIVAELQLPWLLKYLTLYILFDLFNEEMPDPRSGKSKADEGEQNSELIQIITSKFNRLKQDLISEIESLIQLEVEKVMRKQKEEFDQKRQERILTHNTRTEKS